MEVLQAKWAGSLLSIRSNEESEQPEENEETPAAPDFDLEKMRQNQGWVKHS